MAVQVGHGRAEASLSAVARWWGAGLVRGEAGEGRPDWAALAEEAVAAAPAEAVAPEGEYPGLSGFEWVLRPFTLRAGERLEGRLSERARRLVDLAAVREDLQRQLSGRLARAAARTLVLELHEARTAGLLEGDDTRARFRDFLARTASRRGLSALLAGRPVLARILGRAALDSADAVAEALERWADDRPRLTAGLLGASRASDAAGESRAAGEPYASGEPYAAGESHASGEPYAAGESHASGAPYVAGESHASGAPYVAGESHASGEADGAHEGCESGEFGGSGRQGPGLLVGIEPGAGDGHRNGRSVMLLRFADGTRLVYKPRPLAAHRHFNALVTWYNGLPGAVDLRTLRLLDRGDYGWVEFVVARPCASAEEVETFYRRQGALLALLHLLDGTDVHHENLIAVGAHPVLVDVETLFHPPLPVAATEDPAARALHDSVYRVGLLPQLLVGDHSALDVSAVGGGHEAVSPVDRPDWAGAGTDRMRLVRRAGTFGESANRPHLAGGGPIEPGAHVEALCAGFRAGYTVIGAAREELLHGTSLLKDFAEDEVRVVVRPTWIYSMLLDESTHPGLLKDADERQRVLESLRTDLFGAVLEPGLVDEEIAQLWSGDVPLFTARPGLEHLWGAPERLPAGRAELPGTERVAAKIGALDTVDRQDQEWIVRAAMATTSGAAAHRPAEGRRTGTADRAPEPERLLSAARSVGDQLVSLAYRDGPRSNWIGLELLDDRYWRIGPMPADLAGGYTGPALFLAQLAALTGAGHYAEAARTALAPVPDLLDALSARPEDLGAVGSGAFSGLGGIAYALTGTARLLDDPEVASWAATALRLATAATRAEREYGVGAGLAGGLVSLLAVHGSGVGGGAEHTGRDLRRTARACADRLAEADVTGVGRGFAEGAAGIGWALLRFARAETEPWAGEPPASGGEAVERYRTAGLSALRTAVGGGPDGSRGSAWCRGDAGVALAVLDAPGALDDPYLAAWSRRTVEELGRDRPAPDDSLCHGEAGVCELLGHGALPEARPHWIRRAGTLLASVEEHDARSGAPDGVPHPGLLTGLAGIGHGLLRAGFPERVPSLLLLSPPGSGPEPG
ncbi:type 2 lanthipeptide synthetase LanM family protein [Streptomyces sp. NPDC002057]|uniref:type 2 lanthipeptide synthetase LanM family protein n=1 Tax=Streptomyces sp. NPDC002057 TaxID=3154664 RepID=UPI003321D680